MTMAKRRFCLKKRASFFLKHGKKKYFLKILNQIQDQKANELGHLIELSHVWAFNSMHEKVCTNTYNVTKRSSVKHFFMIAENDEFQS